MKSQLFFLKMASLGKERLFLGPVRSFTETQQDVEAGSVVEMLSEAVRENERKRRASSVLWCPRWNKKHLRKDSSTKSSTVLQKGENKLEKQENVIFLVFRRNSAASAGSLLRELLFLDAHWDAKIPSSIHAHRHADRKAEWERTERPQWAESL